MMTLAFQRGEIDLDKFEQELDPKNLDRWEQWFERRPQDMHHFYKFMALCVSTICASNGVEVDPDGLVYWDKTPTPPPSQAEIDFNTEVMLERIRLANSRKKPKDAT